MRTFKNQSWKPCLVGLQRARSRVAPGQEISPGRGAVVWPCGCGASFRHICELSQDQRKNAEEMLLPEIFHDIPEFDFLKLVSQSKCIASLQFCLDTSFPVLYIYIYIYIYICIYIYIYIHCKTLLCFCFVLRKQFLWSKDFLRFKVIGEAYEVLTDPTKKELYEKGSDGIG